MQYSELPPPTFKRNWRPCIHQDLVPYEDMHVNKNSDKIQFERIEIEQIEFEFGSMAANLAYSVNPTSGMLPVASCISEMHEPMLLYTKHNQQYFMSLSHIVLNNFFRWLGRDKCSGWTLGAPLLKQRPEISTSLPPRTIQQVHGWKQARIQGGGGRDPPPLLSTTNFFFQQTF